jgi:hypothetical protein
MTKYLVGAVVCVQNIRWSRLLAKGGIVTASVIVTVTEVTSLLLHEASKICIGYIAALSEAYNSVSLRYWYQWYQYQTCSLQKVITKNCQIVDKTGIDFFTSCSVHFTSNKVLRLHSYH